MGSENDDEVSAKQSFEDAITEPGIDDCSDKEDKRKTTSSFRCECEDFEDNIVSDSDPTKSEENQESRTLTKNKRKLKRNSQDFQQTPSFSLNSSPKRCRIIEDKEHEEVPSSDEDSDMEEIFGNTDS